MVEEETDRAQGSRETMRDRTAAEWPQRGPTPIGCREKSSLTSWQMELISAPEILSGLATSAAGELRKPFPAWRGERRQPDVILGLSLPPPPLSLNQAKLVVVPNMSVLLFLFFSYGASPSKKNLPLSQYVWIFPAWIESHLFDGMFFVSLIQRKHILLNYFFFLSSMSGICVFIFLLDHKLGVFI